MDKILLYVISDQNVELEVMELTIKHYFSSRCTEIKPLLINAQNINFLSSQKNCILVLEKKFEGVIHFYIKENNNNKIIPITVEKGKREIQVISEAIFEYEEKLFSEYINSLT